MANGLKEVMVNTYKQALMEEKENSRKIEAAIKKKQFRNRAEIDGYLDNVSISEQVKAFDKIINQSNLQD